MTDAVILAFDIGTSGVKTSLTSQNGSILDAQTENYHTHYAPGGIAEQDPMDWWEGIRKATSVLLEKHPECKSKIAGIGVSGHMMGSIPVDRVGMPLHPCLIHSDSRSQKQFGRIAHDIGTDRLYTMSGNVVDARSSLCKMLWFKEERPDIYRQASKFIQSKDFIVSRLIGNPDTTDCSDACHGGMMDINRRAYDNTLYQELGLDMAKLPEIHKGCDIVGRVCEDSARFLGIPSGIPVIAGGGDGACGCAGAASVDVGDAYLNLGSTAWISRVVDKPIIDPEKRIFNIMNLDGETTSVYGTMQSGGSSINWVAQMLGVKNLTELNDMAARVDPGSDGLVYLPYLEGERSPVFDASACGVFIGVSVHHDARHFARAVFEGTAFALRQIADILRIYEPLTTLKAIGGGMKSAIWPQIIADIGKLTLQTLSVPASDATSRGVAAVAGTSVGVFPDLHTALSLVKIAGTVSNVSNDERYERNYKAYTQLYPALKDTMHLLTK